MPVVQEENKVALTAANGSQGVEQPVIHTLNEPVATIHRTEVKPVIEPAFEPEPVAEKTESYMQKNRCNLQWTKKSQGKIKSRIRWKLKMKWRQ